jgi:putative nucleotidyltransferase with HDIG domain
MFKKEEALKLLHSKMQNQNLRRHCYAVGAVMKALARRFGENEEVWEIVGLLHDGDYEETKATPEFHTLKMVEWLKEKKGVDKTIADAILTHNYVHTGQNPPTNKIEWALYCCDELTGLIVAVALVKPDKKLSSVSVESILNKWRSSSFAAGVDRKQIEECESKLGIDLHDFIQIAVSAMQSISVDLGL